MSRHSTGNTLNTFFTEKKIEMKRILFFPALCLLVFSTQLTAQCSHDGNHKCVDEVSSCCSTSGWTSIRPDGNAPIGVMADHYHHKGGAMVSYRFMNMNMDGNINGNSEISDGAIYQYYMMAPQDMNMQMHMIGVMYAPAKKITLAVMANYFQNEMNATLMGSENHYHASRGWGDTKVNAIAGLWRSGHQSFHINAGLSIPTGDIDQASIEPMEHMGMVMQKYPYRMQLGSGTWDVLLGATYLAQNDQFSFGAQASSVLRTGENANGYRFGNLYQLTAWTAWKTTKWLSFSLRGRGSVEDTMNGSDPDLERIMSPVNDPENFGGERIEAFAGFNIYVASGAFKGLRIGLEYGYPLYQNANGIQMRHRGMLNAGIKYSLF